MTPDVKTVKDLKDLLDTYPDDYKVRMAMEGYYPSAYLMIRDRQEQEISTVKFENDDHYGATVSDRRSGK